MTIAQISLVERAMGFLRVAIINDLSGDGLREILDDAIKRIELAKIQKEE